QQGRLQIDAGVQRFAEAPGGHGGRHRPRHRRGGRGTRHLPRIAHRGAGGLESGARAATRRCAGPRGPAARRQRPDGGHEDGRGRGAVHVPGPAGGGQAGRAMQLDARVLLDMRE
ncbi:unnamed protein product, partial [Prorocentrum cordatum]